MKILYYSVHQILEFDEIRMFHGLGCFVFPLGNYFGGTLSQPFRPAIAFDPPFEEYLAHFSADGGHYGAPEVTVIPRAFVERFDVVVVMHEFDFLEKHWDALSAVPVIWRSIGVGTEMCESRVVSLRERGCHVVRYCPTEQRATGYAGHDAIIRFCKPDSDFRPWLGTEPQILTFSHQFRQRFPQEHAFYSEATSGFPTMLGGDGNQGLPGAIGIVDFARQNELLARSAAYYYAGGTFIPYTLNFMEAWLSGIPLVATDCRVVLPPENCKFAEVPQLIESGVDGFLVRTPSEAQETFRMLAADQGLARRVGETGAAKARSLFSESIIAPLWRRLFAEIGLPIHAPSDGTRHPSSHDPDVGPVQLSTEAPVDVPSDGAGHPSSHDPDVGSVPLSEETPVPTPARKKGLIARLFSR